MNKIILTLFLMLSLSASAYIEDDFVQSTLFDKEIEKPQTHTKYDYSGTTSYPVKLSIVSPINSEKEVYEGQIIKLRLEASVYNNKKVIVRRGQYAYAKIETIITNGMNGIPASIVLGDFKIANIPQSQLSNRYEKFGLDLSLLVFPLKWALTPLYPSGSLTNFIKGGHCKIKENDIITIYYHPDWI